MKTKTIQSIEYTYTQAERERLLDIVEDLHKHYESVGIEKRIPQTQELLNILHGEWVPEEE
jgi:hypothetical protein